MLLKNKNAIIYGGGGAVGGAVASAFARGLQSGDYRAAVKALNAVEQKRGSIAPYTAKKYAPTLCAAAARVTPSGRIRRQLTPWRIFWYLLLMSFTVGRCKGWH